MKRQKKVSVVTLGIMMLFAIICMMAEQVYTRNHVAGTFTQPEQAILEVNQIDYIPCENPPCTSEDVQKLLGIVKDGEETYEIFTIQGDVRMQYLYLSDTGAEDSFNDMVYERADLADAS